MVAERQWATVSFHAIVALLLSSVIEHTGVPSSGNSAECDHAVRKPAQHYEGNSENRTQSTYENSTPSGNVSPSLSAVMMSGVFPWSQCSFTMIPELRCRDASDRSCLQQ